MARADILTVGNEIVSGDTENTNASWLARRLAGLGIDVRLIAAIHDDIEEIAAFLRVEAPRVEHVFVTGGLGGTPDDLTREGVAAAFGRECEEIAEVAAVLRARFEPRGLGDYAARWACLPRGAEPLMNPLGGAPGFILENVARVTEITCTLDTHVPHQIFFPSFWVGRDGSPLGAHREVLAEDVRRGEARPSPAAASATNLPCRSMRP